MNYDNELLNIKRNASFFQILSSQLNLDTKNNLSSLYDALNSNHSKDNDTVFVNCGIGNGKSLVMLNYMSNGHEVYGFDNTNIDITTIYKLFHNIKSAMNGSLLIDIANTHLDVCNNWNNILKFDRKIEVLLLESDIPLFYLEHLYSKVIPGGMVLGPKKLLETFMNYHNIYGILNEVNGLCSFVKKVRNVVQIGCIDNKLAGDTNIFDEQFVFLTEPDTHIDMSNVNKLKKVLMLRYKPSSIEDVKRVLKENGINDIDLMLINSEFKF